MFSLFVFIILFFNEKFIISFVFKYFLFTLHSIICPLKYICKIIEVFGTYLYQTRSQTKTMTRIEQRQYFTLYYIDPIAKSLNVVNCKFIKFAMCKQ